MTTLFRVNDVTLNIIEKVCKMKHAFKSYVCFYSKDQKCGWSRLQYLKMMTVVAEHI